MPCFTLSTIENPIYFWLVSSAIDIANAMDKVPDPGMTQYIEVLRRESWDGGIVLIGHVSQYSECLLPISLKFLELKA